MLWVHCLLLLLLQRVAARMEQVLLGHKPTTIHWIPLRDVQWSQKRLFSREKGRYKVTHSTGNKDQKLGFLLSQGSDRLRG